MTNGANPAAAARRVAVLVLTLGIATTCTGCWGNPYAWTLYPEADVASDPRCEDSDACAPGLVCRKWLTDEKAPEARCRPPLAEGELCCGSDQCAPGLLCFGECPARVCPYYEVCKTGSDLAPWTCLKPAEIGEACYPNEITTGCRPGLFCVDPWIEGNCGFGTGSGCVATCYDGGGGAPCGGSWDCQDGLVCGSLDVLEPETCESPPTVGEPCLDYGLDCEEGLSCLESDSGAVCGPIKELGEECGDDEDCGDPWMLEVYCDDLNGSPPVCRTEAKLGEFCRDDREAACENDLECYGEPVGIDLDSPPFSWTSEAKRCGLPDRIGDHCWGSSCLEGTCISHTCVPLNDGGLGDLCYSVLSFGCQEGLVCNWGLQPATCQPPGEVGEPCAWTPHCREGLVCSPGVDFFFTYDLEAMTEAMLNSVCSDPTLTSEPCDPSLQVDPCPGGDVCSDYFDPPICAIAGTYGSSCGGGVDWWDWGPFCNPYQGFFCDDWDGGKCTTKVPEEPEYPFN